MTFKNDSSQAERKAFVKDSYHTRYQDEAGGRWQKQTPTQVTGKDPATLYPKLPTSSPWSSDPVPPEEALGIDVSEAPIVGEPHEVLASQQPFSWLRDRSSTPVAGGDDVAAAPASSSTGCSTSLSEPRAASEDGVTPTRNAVGAPPSSPKSKPRRRLV
jgi:hypothetical protein